MSFETVQSSGKVDRPRLADDVRHVTHTVQLVVDVAEIRNFEHVDLVPVDGASASSFISASCLPCPLRRLMHMTPLTSGTLTNLARRKHPRLPVDPVRRTTLVPASSAFFLPSVSLPRHTTPPSLPLLPTRAFVPSSADTRSQSQGLHSASV